MRYWAITSSIVGPLTIRVAGDRIGIETMLFDYLDVNGLGAEDDRRWRDRLTLSREDVHRQCVG
jgi:hypothetical protein